MGTGFRFEFPEVHFQAIYVHNLYLGPNILNYFMLGSQLTMTNSSTSDNAWSADNGGMLINDTLFYHVDDFLVIGVETNFYYDMISNQTSFGVFPQIHVVLTSSFVLQIGYGFVVNTIDGSHNPVFALRAVNAIA